MIPDLPHHPETHAGKILLFLARQGDKWSTWGPSFYMPTVQSVLPVGTKEETQWRFMRMLQHLDLVGGCNCGCRGDYTITEKGLQYLEEGSLSGRQTVAKYRLEFPAGLSCSY